MRTRTRVQKIAAIPTRRNTVQEQAWRVALQHLGSQLVTEPNRAPVNEYGFPLLNHVSPLSHQNWRALETVSRNSRRHARFFAPSSRLVGKVRFYARFRPTNRNRTKEKADLLGYLMRGANPDFRAGELAEAPLHFASVSDDNLHIVKLLLEHGANPNAKTAQKETPLGIASSYGAPRVATLLKKYGAVLG